MADDPGVVASWFERSCQIQTRPWASTNIFFELVTSGRRVGMLRSCSVFARRFAVGCALKFLAHPLLEGRHVLRTAQDILHQIIR